MLEIALSREAPWPDLNWDTLACRAVGAAVDRTPLATALRTAEAEISVRLTSDEEVHVLNRDYRQKDKATNVLSFPMLEPGGFANLARRPEVLLGDIVLAHGICAAEAAERDISLADHASHLLVHGTLHLLGYDHMTDREAEAMEAIERDALAQLGLHDPYPIED